MAGMKIISVETFSTPFIGFVRITSEDGAQGCVVDDVVGRTGERDDGRERILRRQGARRVRHRHRRSEYCERGIGGGHAGGGQETGAQ